MMKSKRMRLAWNVSRKGKRNACRTLVGKLEGGTTKKAKKPRSRWVDNIKMDLREIGWSGMDSIDLARDRHQWRALVSTVMNLRIPQNIGKFLSCCVTGGF
jgi:hypothetical protein